MGKDKRKKRARRLRFRPPAPRGRLVKLGSVQRRVATHRETGAPLGVARPECSAFALEQQKAILSAQDAGEISSDEAMRRLDALGSAQRYRFVGAISPEGETLYDLDGSVLEGETMQPGDSLVDLGAFLAGMREAG